MTNDPTQWFMPPVPRDVQKFNLDMNQLRKRSEEFKRLQLAAIRQRRNRSNAESPELTTE